MTKLKNKEKKKQILLITLYQQSSIHTSPRTSESRKATGRSLHAIRGRSFSPTLSSLLKAYKGSLAPVSQKFNETNIRKTHHTSCKPEKKKHKFKCMNEITLNATTLEAIPTTTSDRGISFPCLIFLIIGNHRGNPLNAQHLFNSFSHQIQQQQQQQKLPTITMEKK